MNIHFCPLTGSEADAIAGWRYLPPYDFYNWDPTVDPSSLLTLLPPFLAARNDRSDLVGFLCFGVAAQVPGGHVANLYQEDLLDIGLGLRPDLTGRGCGQAFVTAALEFTTDEFRPRGFRLTVATFNERAIRVYERTGFKRGERCAGIAHGTDAEFILMRKFDETIASTRA